MNTSCILVTKADIVSNLIAIASLLREIWLATDSQTDTHTDNLRRL